MPTNEPIEPTDLDRRTVETNGVRLHVMTAGPTDGKPVLLLHGFPEFWYGWRHQIGPLADAGYRLWIPDQRGYNRSDKPPTVAAYAFDRLVRDTLGLLDEMGSEPATIVGHDWGGGIGWAVATRFPDRIDRLVAVNAPHPSVFRRYLTTDPRQMLMSSYMAFFQIPRVPEHLFTWRRGRLAARMLRRSGRPDAFTRTEIRRYRRAWNRSGAPTGMLNWYRAIVRYRPTLVRTPIVRPPTLVIWGRDDPGLRRELVGASLERCEDGRASVVDSATHWVHHEEPGIVSGLIEEFLGK